MEEPRDIPTAAANGVGVLTAHVDEVRLACLRALERKVLWLSTWMIHHANHLRPSRDGLKVGGHQASCASLVTLMTALYFDVLAAPGPGRGQAPRQPGLPRDPVPAGAAEPREARAVPRLRRGAVVPVADQGQRRRRLLDGLGRPGGGDHPVRLAGPGLPPAQAAGARRPARGPDDRPGRRRRARRGQRLRGPPRRLEARRPQRLVDHRLQPPEPRQRGRGPALPAGSTALSGRWAGTSSRSSTAAGSRRRSSGPAARRCGTGSTTAPTRSTRPWSTAAAPAGGRGSSATWGRPGGSPRCSTSTTTPALHALMTNLGGHDMETVLEAFHGVDDRRPDLLHRLHDQGLRPPLRRPQGQPLGPDEPRADGDLPAAPEDRAGAGVRAVRRPGRSRGRAPAVPRPGALRRAAAPPARAARASPCPRPWRSPRGADVDPGGVRPAPERPGAGPGRVRRPDRDDLARRDGLDQPRRVGQPPRPVRPPPPRRPVPRGGGALGPEVGDVARPASTSSWASPRTTCSCSWPRWAWPARSSAPGCLPIGTLYDPFICRGLDALNYACYQGARFLLVATPSGVSLAPEGGAHQSVDHPADRHRAAGPDGVRARVRRRAGRDPGLGPGAHPGRRRRLGLPPALDPADRPAEAGDDPELRDDVVRGGYWLVAARARGRRWRSSAPGSSPPRRSRRMPRSARTSPSAGLLVVTSAGRLHADWLAATRARAARRRRGPRRTSSRLLGRTRPGAALVTVLDGHPATLSWLGAVARHRVVRPGRRAVRPVGRHPRPLPRIPPRPPGDHRRRRPGVPGSVRSFEVKCGVRIA